MTPDEEARPLGTSDVESADAGEPERGGREAATEKPDLDQRQERIRTERKPAGPPLREEGGRESPDEEDAERPPDVDPDEA